MRAGSLDELRKAMRGEGDGKQVFLAKHLNVEIGLRLSRDRWRGADYWEDAADRELSLEGLLSRVEVAVVGIDGGGLDDLFGLCIAGRERDTKRWLFWFHAWAQRTVLELRKEVAPALLDFEKDGDLTLVDGRRRHRRHRRDHRASEGCRAVPGEGGGRARSAGCGRAGRRARGDRALVHPQVVAVSQGFRLSSAVWSMERKLKHKQAVHAGSRLMAFCVGNAKAEQKGNAVVITKETAGKAKIDPLIAGFNAAKLLEVNPEAVSDNGGVRAWLQSLKAA
jgi:phage terminase large subunit-like protein